MIHNIKLPRNEFEPGTSGQEGVGTLRSWGEGGSNKARYFGQEFEPGEL